VTETVQAAVIGAGPAGLAASRELTRRGVAHVVLERGRVGESWRRCYDSLRLHTGKHLSALPGLPFPRSVPLFPARTDLIAYLERYTRAFAVPVRERTEVELAEPAPGGWRLRLAGGGRIEARSVVVATGIMSNPHVPAIAGMAAYAGRVRHSIDYRSPAELVGRRVLVVGLGNSAAEVATELARAGVATTVSARSGANVVPLTLLGVPIQYAAFALRSLPRPIRAAVAGGVAGIGELRRCAPPFPRPAHSAADAIPLIGLHLVDAIRAGQVELRGAIDRFTATGVRFVDGGAADFDDVILATGFRPAISLLGARVRTDARGFARRSDRVRSADAEDLVFVGHNYDSVGGLRNIHRDAPLAAEAVRLALAAPALAAAIALPAAGLAVPAMDG
jgi:putative flavoprotein involved in K+ transport